MFVISISVAIARLSNAGVFTSSVSTARAIAGFASDTAVCTSAHSRTGSAS